MFDGWSRSQDTLHSAVFGLGILCPKVMEVENRNSSWKVTTIAGDPFYFTSMTMGGRVLWSPIRVFFWRPVGFCKDSSNFIWARFKTPCDILWNPGCFNRDPYNGLWNNPYITQVGCHLQFNRNQPGWNHHCSFSDLFRPPQVLLQFGFDGQDTGMWTGWISSWTKRRYCNLLWLMLFGWLKSQTTTWDVWKPVDKRKIFTISTG